MKKKYRWHWICGEIRWFCLRVLHVLLGKYYISEKHYGKADFHPMEEGNKKLKELIESGRPFTFGRESFVEFDLLIKSRTKEYFGVNTLHKLDKFICSFSALGIEDANKALVRFVELMEESIENADIIGAWDSLAMADTYLDTVEGAKDRYITHASVVDAFNFDNPWSKALEGKKVLVVNPFYKEIQSQYDNVRSKLWKNKDILPEFKLKAIDSVWFFAGQYDPRFNNRIEAIEYLYEQIMKEDFDIALLGCGAMGFPLSSMIKKAGKQAIHMGGSVQILFGVKGNRWDNNGVGDRFYNECWIRPGEDTKPKGASRLDASCYW